MGKSTLVRRLIREWNSRSNGVAIFVDLEPWVGGHLFGSEEARARYYYVRPEQFAELFFQSILESGGTRLPRQLRRRYGNWQGQADLIAFLGQHNLTELIAQTSRELRAAGLDPLLIIDEPIVLVRDQIIELSNPPNPLPPGVRAVSQVGETSYSYHPDRAVAAQANMPDVWILPLDPKGRPFHIRIEDLAHSDPRTSLETYYLRDESRESIQRYIFALTEGTPIRFSSDAIDAVVQGSEGRPLSVRLILSELPDGVTEVNRGHVARAIGRARTRDIALSRGNEATSHFISAFPPVSEDGLSGVDWRSHIRKLARNFSNAELPSRHRAFIEDGMRNPRSISVVEFDSNLRFSQPIERGAPQDAIILGFSLRDNRDTPLALRVLSNLETTMSGLLPANLGEALPRLIYDLEAGRAVEAAPPGSIQARIIQAVQEDNLTEAFQILRDLFPGRLIAVKLRMRGATEADVPTLNRIQREAQAPIFVESLMGQGLDNGLAARLNASGVRRIEYSIRQLDVFGSVLRSLLPENAQLTDSGLRYLHEVTNGDLNQAMDILATVPSDLTTLGREELLPIVTEYLPSVRTGQDQGGSSVAPARF